MASLIEENRNRKAIASPTAKMVLGIICSQVALRDPVSYPAEIDAIEDPKLRKKARDKYLNDEVIENGVGLGLDYQIHKAKGSTGGGWISYTAIGARVNPLGSRKEWKNFASRWARSLMGLPGPQKRGSVPALAYAVDGGNRQHAETKEWGNRSWVWGVPIVNVSVEVPMPKSDDEALRENWTLDEMWDRARPLLKEQFGKIAVIKKVQQKKDEYYEDNHACMPEEIEEALWEEMTEYVESRIDEADTSVEALIAKWRPIQESKMHHIYKAKAWWKKSQGLPYEERNRSKSTENIRKAQKANQERHAARKAAEATNLFGEPPEALPCPETAPPAPVEPEPVAEQAVSAPEPAAEPVINEPVAEPVAEEAIPATADTYDDAPWPTEEPGWDTEAAWGDEPDWDEPVIEPHRAQALALISEAGDDVNPTQAGITEVTTALTTPAGGEIDDTARKSARLTIEIAARATGVPYTATDEEIDAVAIRLAEGDDVLPAEHRTRWASVATAMLTQCFRLDVDTAVASLLNALDHELAQHVRPIGVQLMTLETHAPVWALRNVDGTPGSSAQSTREHRSTPDAQRPATPDAGGLPIVSDWLI
ncbi:hypothetical protein AB0J83_30890 [Actinoplanes sp. NPDC049596]|uniref:hypothetical protein n=1 Tax=unclassified Actinoplanes TaxID=2626549 RepID=UPI0034326C59